MTGEPQWHEIDEWRDAVDHILRMDKNIPGAGHLEEDRLLERFVREVAWGGADPEDPRAVALCRLLDTPRRRWHT